MTTMIPAVIKYTIESDLNQGNQNQETQSQIFPPLTLVELTAWVLPLTPANQKLIIMTLNSFPLLVGSSPYTRKLMQNDLH